MIGVVDYGMGNLKSVTNALEAICVSYIVTDKIKELEKCKGIILPGVGAFNDAINNLKEKGLFDYLKENAKKKPFLGICLGMQLLFEEGYEGKKVDGLGLLKGKIKMIDSKNVRVPHIGWNSSDIYKNDEVIEGIEEKSFFYYVHSYVARDFDYGDLIIACDYNGEKIPGLFRRENVIGAQFHPEKSGDDGLRLLENFCKIVEGFKW